jgi:hypothetical protein
MWPTGQYDLELSKQVNLQIPASLKVSVKRAFLALLVLNGILVLLGERSVANNGT